jgi:hypothetical protein
MRNIGGGELSGLLPGQIKGRVCGANWHRSGRGGREWILAGDVGGGRDSPHGVAETFIARVKRVDSHFYRDATVNSEAQLRDKITNYKLPITHS